MGEGEGNVIEKDDFNEYVDELEEELKRTEEPDLKKEDECKEGETDEECKKRIEAERMKKEEEAKAGQKTNEVIKQITEADVRRMIRKEITDYFRGVRSGKYPMPFYPYPEYPYPPKKKSEDETKSDETKGKEPEMTDIAKASDVANLTTKLDELTKSFDGLKKDIEVIKTEPKEVIIQKNDGDTPPRTDKRILDVKITDLKEGKLEKRT